MDDERWCWTENDVFHGPFVTREEAIADAEECCEDGDKVTIDVCYQVPGEAYLPCDVGNLLDEMEERLHGDFQHDDVQIFDLKTNMEDAERDLKNALEIWYQRHVSMSQFLTTEGSENEIEHVVGSGD